MTFFTRVAPHDEMDFVGVLGEARPARDGKGFVVEVMLPWKGIGFTPVPDVKCRGDFGVTRGAPAGTRVREQPGNRAGG